MATFLPIRDTKVAIDNTPIVDGQFLITTDLEGGNSLQIDIGASRKLIVPENVDQKIEETGMKINELEGYIDGFELQLAQKAEQVDLDTANDNIALKADKSEVTNVMTPKGNIAYASLPTTGNTIGWYYYCPDGDGTHGAGNYVWNGTAWYFGGTGNEGYNILKDQLNFELGITDSFALTGKVTDGYMYNPSTGVWSTNSSVVTTNVFEIGKTRVINTSIDTGFVVLFDANKNFISAPSTTASPRSYTVTDNTAKYCAIMYLKSGYTYANIAASTVSGLLIRNLPSYSNVALSVNIKETIEVGVGKEYTSLLSALEYASSIKDKQIIINIYTGDYDLYAEMGGDNFVSSIASGAKWSDIQPVLEGDVVINGIGNVAIRLEIPSNIYTSYKTRAQLLSILNNRGSIQTNNISFITANNRYAIHDECDDISGYENTIHKFVNCRFYGNNSMASIGIGASASEYVVDKCYLNNTWNGFYLHGWGDYNGANLLISDSIVIGLNHGINLGVNSVNTSNVKIVNSYTPDIYVFSEKPASYTNNIFRIIGSNNNISTVTTAAEIVTSTYEPVLLNW